MLTLVIHDENLAKRIEKSLAGYEPFEDGSIYLNDREDGTYELYIGEESQDDVVVDVEE